MKYLWLLPALVLLSACVPAPPPPGSSAAPSTGLAVYLTQTPLSGREVLAADLATLDLQPAALITPQDILAYDRATHTLALSPAAMQRVIDLRVPLDGLAFVVTAGGERVYAGAFWTPISSLSFDGPSILQPFEVGDGRLQIDAGYPGGLEGAADPRSDPRILAVLPGS